MPLSLKQLSAKLNSEAFDKTRVKVFGEINDGKIVIELQSVRFDKENKNVYLGFDVDLTEPLPDGEGK